VVPQLPVSLKRRIPTKTSYLYVNSRVGIFVYEVSGIFDHIAAIKPRMFYDLSDLPSCSGIGGSMEGCSAQCGAAGKREGSRTISTAFMIPQAPTVVDTRPSQDIPHSGR